MTRPDSAEIRRHLDGLTKPPGSLGRLESLAARLCEIQQTLEPKTTPRQLTVFVADHGVVASGVSAWPAKVTRLMVQNILGGGAASSVFCRSTGTTLRVVDVGVIADAEVASRVVDEDAARFRQSPIAAGTQDLSLGPAMTVDQARRAMEIGAEEAERALRAGHRVLLAGEMGIGNSTAAACLSHVLGHVPMNLAVGRGANADDATLARKREAVAKACARVAAIPDRDRDPLRIASEVGGFEILAMAGYFMAGARAGATLVLDGYIATAAALIAQAMQPTTTQHMIAAHCSAEPGHRAALAALHLEPMLDWQLRLGEGTGALLLLPLMDAAAAMCSQMSTLDELLGQA